MKFRRSLSILLFFISYVAIIVSIFLPHTRGLFYGGGVSLFLSFLFLLPEEKGFFRGRQGVVFILTVFCITLIPAIFYSPYPQASLDAFLLNYFFHLVLFVALSSLIYQSVIEESLLLRITLIVFALIVVYIFLQVENRCKNEIACWYLAGLSYAGPQVLKGLVSTSPALVWLFFWFLKVSSSVQGFKARIFWIFWALASLFLIIWFGRRAAFLSIILGCLPLFYYTSSKRIKIAFFLLVLFVISGFILSLKTSWGRQLWLRYDKIDLILTGKRELWARAGSLGQRLYIWPLYFREALKHPFKGTGLARRVQKRVLKDLNEKALRLEHTHNLFLNLWLQAGLLPVIFFLIFYGYTLKYALKLAKLGNSTGIYWGGFLIAFLFMSLFEGLEEWTRFTPFWIASALIWGTSEGSSLSRPSA